MICEQHREPDPRRKKSFCDRPVKTSRYGVAGIPVYWLVDLDRQVVDVSRPPDGDAYADRPHHRRGDALPLPSSVEGKPIEVDAVLGTRADAPDGATNGDAA